MKLKEFRCQKCNRLLAKVDGNAEIVCGRCGGVNRLHVDTWKIDYTSKLMKQGERTTLSGKRFD